MIPYDDLVAALASWRARQGLPTGQFAGGASPPPAAPAPKPSAQPAPAAARTTAPAAARPATAPAPAPEAARPASHAESLDFDEGSLLEESGFESDFAMAFNTGDDAGEATAIGAAPVPTRRPPPRHGGR